MSLSYKREDFVPFLLSDSGNENYVNINSIESIYEIPTGAVLRMKSGNKLFTIENMQSVLDKLFI